MSTVGTIYDETIKFSFGKLLHAQTANNSASISFVSVVGDANFDTFLFDFENLQFASAGQTILIRTSADNGASWSAASYHWVLTHHSHALAPPLYFYGQPGAGTYYQPASGIVAAGYPTQGYAILYRGALASNGYKVMEWSAGSYNNNAGYGYVVNFGAGFWGGGGVINGVQFYPNSGVIQSGLFKCYGLRKG